MLILVAEVVPQAGAGTIEGPTAVGGTTGGRAIGVPPGVVVGPEDIVQDVVYCRGAVSNSAQK